MVREIPPFGNCDDSDVKRVLNWFLEFLDPADWADRIAHIEGVIEDVLKINRFRQQAQEYKPVSIVKDRIGWYLYLADTALHAPEKYEPTQGARVLPVFKSLGSDFELLKAIGGIEDRVNRMLTSDREQPDSVLFEILIALLWKRNGYETVEFMPEQPPKKTADFRAEKEGQEWFVECKRLKKNSQYSEQERTKWLAMWAQFREFLIKNNYSAVFEIEFHVELEALPDAFLVEELSGKLPLVQLPCQVISNDVWEVSARAVDYNSVNAHLAEYSVKYPSDQINELIGGYIDPNRGFTALVLGKFVRAGHCGGNNRFLDELEFAAGACWICTAEKAIQRKARDIRGRLANAIRQLPDGENCAVHLALETLDGVAVEKERFRKIFQSVRNFDKEDKDLRWVYCHLFQSYAPPDALWVIDETIHYFGDNSDYGKEPLSHRHAILPTESDLLEGAHWEYEPP